MEQAMAAKAQAQTNYNTWANSIKTGINEMTEILPGQAIDDKMKSRIFESITKIVGQDKSGNPVNFISKKLAEDPKAMYQVAYLLLNNFNMGSMERNASTQASLKLKQVVTPVQTTTKPGATDLGILRRGLKQLEKQRSPFNK
jgi:hypothetical protein